MDNFRRLFYLLKEDIPSSAVAATDGATCNVVYIPLWHGSGNLTFTGTRPVTICYINDKRITYNTSYWNNYGNGPTSVTATDDAFSASSSSVIRGTGHSKGIKINDGSYTSYCYYLTPCIVSFASGNTANAGSIDGWEGTYAKIMFLNTVTVSGNNSMYYIDTV